MKEFTENNFTLLYVEDDPEILENVSFLLSRFVKKVYSASNGEEALELYRQHHPDILVTDISLPKLDGLSMAKKIRENNKNLPIVILTAYNEENLQEKINEINVSSYLQKPFTLQGIKLAMMKAIGEK